MIGIDLDLKSLAVRPSNRIIPIGLGKDKNLVFISKPTIKFGLRKRIVTSILAFTFSMFIGMSIITLIVLFLIRRKAEEIDSVMEDLKAGRLDARIKINKTDEFGQAFIKFNNMADQIESLVNNLKQAEGVRKTLLRELAHDLRTPIASLRSSLELLEFKSDAISEEKKKSLLKTSLSEVVYFENLVDDLLFLGEVSEPRFKKEKAVVEIQDLIESEIENLRDKNNIITVEASFSGIENPFLGDKHLLKRMVRNILENASRFARQKIVIRVHQDENELRFFVEDDGPGFDEKSLKDFGLRKYNRLSIVHKNGEEHISVGLGSVIAKSIAEAYHGSLVAENIIKDNKTVGAVVSIILKH